MASFKVGKSSMVVWWYDMSTHHLEQASMSYRISRCLRRLGGALQRHLTASGSASRLRRSVETLGC